MTCRVAHRPANFPGIQEPIHPEFHGLSLSREQRGPITDHFCESKTLNGEQRQVRIYQPAANFLAEDMPIIIVHDGHKAFAPSPSRGHQEDPWQQKGTLQMHRIMDGMLCEGRITPSIVAAVAPRAGSRFRDYLPHEIEVNGHKIGGEGERYLDFIQRDLLPMIREDLSDLPLSRDPKRVILVGSSVGGLSAIYGALTRPDQFGGVIALSPSAWIEDGMLERVVRGLPKKHDIRIAIDIGEEEAPHNKHHCGLLFQALRERGWQDGVDLIADFPHGHHDENSWRARLPRLLEFAVR